MTAEAWGCCPSPRRPSELLTRGDVYHVHADRAAAEQCGVLLGDAPELVRRDEVRSRGLHDSRRPSLTSTPLMSAWSDSDAAGPRAGLPTTKAKSVAPADRSSQALRRSAVRREANGGGASLCPRLARVFVVVSGSPSPTTRSPALRRPRSRRTWSDSILWPRRRGVAGRRGTAARSAAPKGRAWPRAAIAAGPPVAGEYSGETGLRFEPTSRRRVPGDNESILRKTPETRWFSGLGWST